jgi:hypothetical protein
MARGFQVTKGLTPLAAAFDLSSAFQRMAAGLSLRKA